MSQKVLLKNDLEQIGGIALSFKLLSDPTRLNIICLLFKNKAGMCVYEIAEAIGVSQSAASHQLAKLEARNVVESFREGQKVCYVIAHNPGTKNLEKVISILKQ